MSLALQFKFVLLLVLCLNCEQGYLQTTPVIRFAVADISTNVNIYCFFEADSPGYNVYFWKISGSVYGALHLPKVYGVCRWRCDLATLTIPVVLAEMDGYTFQCFGINYQTNSVFEGRMTELNVTVLSANINGT